MAEPQQSYNPVFEKLVTDQDKGSAQRLIGMLAYAYYKEEKQRFFQNHAKGHSGATPDEEQLQNVFRHYIEDEQFDDVKNKVQITLMDFAKNYSDRSVTTELSQHIDQHFDQLNSKSRHAFKKNIAAGILASFTYSLIVALVIFTITVNKPDSNLAIYVHALFTNAEIQLVKPPASNPETSVSPETP